MIDSTMVGNVLNRYRKWRLASWRKADDHPAFENVVAGYRKRGFQIGKMVRL